MDATEQEAVQFFSHLFDRFIKCKNEVNERFQEAFNPQHKYRIETRSNSSVLNVSFQG